MSKVGKVVKVEYILGNTPFMRSGEVIDEDEDVLVIVSDYEKDKGQTVEINKRDIVTLRYW